MNQNSRLASDTNKIKLDRLDLCVVPICSAPKGRNLIAQGTALGMLSKICSSPEGQWH